MSKPPALDAVKSALIPDGEHCPSVPKKTIHRQPLACGASERSVLAASPDRTTPSLHPDAEALCCVQPFGGRLLILPEPSGSKRERNHIPGTLICRRLICPASHVRVICESGGALSGQLEQSDQDILQQQPPSQSATVERPVPPQPDQSSAMAGS